MIIIRHLKQKTFCVLCMISIYMMKLIFDVQLNTEEGILMCMLLLYVKILFHKKSEFSNDVTLTFNVKQFINSLKEKDQA